MSSISNISVNTTPAPLDPGVQTQQAGNAQKTDTNLTVSVSVEVTRSGGSKQRIDLELPMIVPADIDFTELEQLLESQLGMLSNAPWDAFGRSAATEMLKNAVGNLGEAIRQGGVEFLRENQQALVGTFAAIEQQAGATIGYYTELLNSGTYPDHTEFLKLMLKTAQDLRELASNAKQAAVQGEFDNVLEQVQKMKDAAQEDYNSAIETIKAENMAAGFQVGGALLGAVVAGFVGGAGGAAIGQLIATISSGTGTLAGTAWKTNAAVDKKEADLFRAGIKALEAAQKMEQASHEAAGELNDIAKALKDFLLGMIKDFNSQQYQVVQRANV